jgi:hypothetical protein
MSTTAEAMSTTAEAMSTTAEAMPINGGNTRMGRDVNNSRSDANNGGNTRMGRDVNNSRKNDPDQRGAQVECAQGEDIFFFNYLLALTAGLQAF